MTATKHLIRGKTLWLPGYYAFDNGVNNTPTDKPEWIDTSGIEQLSIQVAWDGTAFQDHHDVFYVKGTNADTNGSFAPSLNLPIDSYVLNFDPQDFVIVPYNTWRSLHLRASGQAVLTYKNLPRWVSPVLTGVPTQGNAHVNVFGWMV